MNNSNKPSLAVLRVAIEEQRSVSQRLHDDYAQMKGRILAYLGGGFAALIFLYTRTKNATFIPEETYGKVFYFIGLGLAILAISLLLYALTPGEWELSTENLKLECLDDNDERQYLKYVKDRYVACYKTNIRVYSSKQRLLNIAFYPLVFGIMILVIINLFGG